MPEERKPSGNPEHSWPVSTPLIDQLCQLLMHLDQSLKDVQHAVQLLQQSNAGKDRSPEQSNTDVYRSASQSAEINLKPIVELLQSPAFQKLLADFQLDSLFAQKK